MPWGIYGKIQQPLSQPSPGRIKGPSLLPAEPGDGGGHRIALARFRAMTSPMATPRLSERSQLSKQGRPLILSADKGHSHAKRMRCVWVSPTRAREHLPDLAIESSNSNAGGFGDGDDTSNPLFPHRWPARYFRRWRTPPSRYNKPRAGPATEM